MKKLLLLLMALFIAVPSQTLAAVPSNTIGRVLLQVEQRGEAWYVDPITESRYYLKDGPVAYEALRTFGLGITNADLNEIPIGYDDRLDFGIDSDGDGLSDRFENGIHTDPNDADSDNDGYSDGEEIRTGNNPNGVRDLSSDKTMSKRLSGRILLQVEDRGEAWYVNPVDGKRYYMTDGEAAYSIMRYLSLGIKDADLLQIPTHDDQYEVFSCGYLDPLCFIGHAVAGNNVQFNANRETYRLANVLVANYFVYFSKDYAGGFTMNGELSFDLDLKLANQWVYDYTGYDYGSWLLNEDYLEESISFDGSFGCSLESSDVQTFGPYYETYKAGWNANGWDGVIDADAEMSYEQTLELERAFNDCTYNYDYDYNYVDNR